MRAPWAEAPRASDHDGLPRVDRRVGDGERAPDAGVQPRLAPQRLGDVDLLRRQLGLRAAGEELVAVGRVVVGRGDEQAARVLDAVRDDLAQDRVLDHALLGGDGVLDDVAAAGVQQAVEAAARALGEVAALDEHDVEAAQGGVPRDAGAGGAAADDEDVGLDGRHERDASPRGEGRRAAPPPASRKGLAPRAVEPVERAGDRALPVLVVLVALGGVHRGLPPLVLDPVLAQVLDLAPEARWRGRPRRRRPATSSRAPSAG